MPRCVVERIIGRHVVCGALQPQSLKATAQAICQRAIGVEIDFVAFGGFAFHALALDADGGAATSKLALTFGKQIGTTKIGNDLRQHVAEAS